MNNSMDNYNIIIGVEYDINKRWEQGYDHHPNSISLMEKLKNVDWHHCDDHFCWKTGGYGDNGETLMYELDIIFEEEETLKTLRQCADD